MFKMQYSTIETFYKIMSILVVNNLLQYTEAESGEYFIIEIIVYSYTTNSSTRELFI